jgi:hypothetical protein
VFVTVHHQKAPTECLDRPDVRQPRPDCGVVAVAACRDEPPGQFPERVEDRGRREVAGEERAVGRRDRLPEVVGESWVLPAVGVGERDEHAFVSTPPEE